MKRGSAPRRDTVLQQREGDRRMARPDKKGVAGASSITMRGCPNCGMNSRLAELDLVPGSALGHFDEDGLWEFDGETEIFWDGQRQEHDPARFMCFNCDAVFDLSGKTYSS